MEVLEEEEASSCPAATFGGWGSHDIRDDIYERLVEGDCEEVVSNPCFREQLLAHFNRLPQSYLLDLSVDRADDVLLHQKLLAEATHPEKRPVFHVRFIKGNLQHCTRVPKTSRRCSGTGLEDMQSCARIGDCEIDFEPCSKLEDLILDVRKDAEEIFEEEDTLEASSTRNENLYSSVYEIIFSTVDRPKLLSQLSALLSDVGLDIREAHVFSTTDGYSLDAFVVDGWSGEDIDGLHKALKFALARSEGSLSGSSSRTLEVDPVTEARLGGLEINMRLLKMGEKIGCGSCGDQYHGSYMGQDVAIKVLRTENLNDALVAEFTHEVSVLRKVQHENVVHFIGACAKPPQLCIVTEYMPCGSLYDFLRKHRAVLPLPLLLKLAIDICKGMEYLHQNNIIHRDLKTANLLMNKKKVVKVADFGVARFQDQEGIMTAETGTYRWMAPEVINHQPYNEKADVFSFAVVLWELATSKIPYETLTPLQAALGVRQGLRPELPDNAHPKLQYLMKRCWESDPSIRPSFSKIKTELEEFLLQLQEMRSQVRPARRKTSKQLKR